MRGCTCLMALLWSLALAGGAWGEKMEVLDLPRQGLVQRTKETLAEGTVRDPFLWRMTPSQGREKLNLQLQGILWNRKHPLAVVNSKLVGIGDMVGGAMVLSIGKEGVVFTTASGATKVLEFKPKSLPLFQPPPGEETKDDEVGSPTH